MPGCSAKRCGKNSSNKNQFDKNGNKVTFHQFPADSKRRDQWVQLVRDAGKGLCWEPKDSAKLCSLHFEEKYINRTLTANNNPVTRLNNDAIPTIFPEVPEKYRNKIRKQAAKKEKAISPRTSSRLAAQKEIFQQIVEEACFDDAHLLDCGVEDGVLIQLFAEVEVQTQSEKSERKMVTLPTDEGYTVYLPDAYNEVEKVPDNNLDNSVPNSSVVLPSVLSDVDSLAPLNSASAKQVNKQGAQPFNADDKDVGDVPDSSYLDACCGAGPSCSSVEPSCGPEFEKTASCPDFCADIESSGGDPATPAYKFNKGIQYMQQFLAQMTIEVPFERLSRLYDCIAQLNEESVCLLRELAIKNHQISQYKRFSNTTNESSEQKQVRIADREDSEELHVLTTLCPVPYEGAAESQAASSEGKQVRIADPEVSAAAELPLIGALDPMLQGRSAESPLPLFDDLYDNDLNLEDYCSMITALLDHQA